MDAFSGQKLTNEETGLSRTLDKGRFIEFLLAQQVLQFGEFTLNSGRISPYFFNLGQINAGAAFAQLGAAYAQTIVRHEIECDVLFGPAYKGIPIAVATAVALAEQGYDVGVAYNRKEAKDHGEGGQLVGAPVTGNVLLIDDVLTSGKAIRDALKLIKSTDARVVGAVIAMDRQEVLAAEDLTTNLERVTAVGKLQHEIGAPVISIATLADVIAYLDDPAQTSATQASATLPQMRAYQTQYCLS
jgi:orotate phosphoribosyltransferase